MIIYCENWGVNTPKLGDASEHGDKAQYQILYSNFGIGNEQFSMNYFNKTTGKYQYVKENSKLWKIGLKYAQFSWNSVKNSIKQGNKALKETKTRI